MEKSLQDYIQGLLADGRHYFTREELEKADLTIAPSSLSVSLSRMAKKGQIKMIKRGFGIILDPGGRFIDPSYYIDALMGHLGAKYYVGLLTAAARWGAAHQASMAYQVVANKPIYPVDLGKGRLQIIVRRGTFPEKGITKVSGVGGYFLASTPELTGIDLVRFPRPSGYLNNVATVLDDLVERWNGKKMMAACQDTQVPTVTLQRLGFILDKILGHQKEAEWIFRALQKRNISPSVLSAVKKKEGVKFKGMEFDEKWELYINTKIEPD